MHSQQRYLETNYNAANPLAQKIVLEVIRDKYQKQIIQQLFINQLLNRLAVQPQQLSSLSMNYPDTHSQFPKLQPTSSLRNQAEQICKTKKIKKYLQNDTKNITKNFGKAIISFIQTKPIKVMKLVQESGVDFEQLLEKLALKKKSVNTIAELRGLWLQEEFQEAKLMRKISCFFLRKMGNKYLYTSRISNREGHLKYKSRLIQAISKPKQFTNIKLY